MAKSLQAAGDKLAAEETRQSALGEIFEFELNDLMTGKRRVNDLDL